MASVRVAIELEVRSVEEKMRRREERADQEEVEWGLLDRLEEADLTRWRESER